MLPPLGLAAAIEYYRNGHIDLKAAIIIASVIFISSWLGSRFAVLKTKQKLSELLGEVGSILRNPVDVSQAQFRGLETLFQSIDLVTRDTTIDVILIQEDTDILLPIYSWKGLEEINDFFIELGSRQNKPIIIVLPPGSAESERMQIEQKLLAASIPVFCSMERAAKAIHNINQYPCR